MIKAEIKDGLVVNVIVVDPKKIPIWCKNWPTITEGGIGWTYDGTKFIEPVVEPTQTEPLVSP